MANDPADRRERFEMLRPGVGRRKQQEHQVDGNSVHGLVANRFGEPEEQAIDLLVALDLSMRDRDSLADAGGAERLPSPEHVEQEIGIAHSRAARQTVRHFAERFVLGRGLEIGDEKIRIEVVKNRSAPGSWFIPGHSFNRE